MKIIAGVDPALDVTGVVIYRPDDGLYKSHTITSDKRSGPGRQVDIRNKIIALVKDVDLVAVEDYFWSDKFAAAFELPELSGVLKVGFYEAGRRVIKVSPLQLKKFATGDSRSKKDQIMLAVYKKWGVDCKTSHEADAWILAKIGSAYIGYRSGLNVAQKEVISKLLNTVQ